MVPGTRTAHLTLRVFWRWLFCSPTQRCCGLAPQCAPASTRTRSVPFAIAGPRIGVLRPQGDGAARSLVCFFCLNEWEFRRIVCPGCGEENDRKLPVFTASDFDYIRVECCDACKTYIKTVDLARNGRAEPVVDELASAPLDLWARDRGYAKLQNNLHGM